MIPRSIWLSLGFLCAGLVTTALADGDVATGQKLAQEHCSRCHDISPNAPFKLVPPSLRSIAVFRPADQIYARMVFPAHLYMPDFSAKFWTDEFDDVIAYIISLDN